MNPTSTAIEVTDEATLLIDDETAAAAKEDGRCTYEIYNNSGETVYLGDSDVTDLTGIPLPVGSSRTIAIRLNGQLHGITETGTADVRVLRVP
jgi:hypothetical protein